MKFYLLLQIRMINRHLSEFGINPILGYALSLLAFFGLSILLFEKTEFAAYIYAFVAVSILLSLSEIKRNDFLKLCFSKKQYLKIRGIENLLLVLPFLCFLLYKGYLAVVLTLLLLAIILALININSNLNWTLPTPFFRRPFEFIIGFRKTFFMFVFAYFLAFIGVSVENFNLSVFSLLLVFLTCLSFYSEPEKSYFVWMFAMKPQAFLFQKMKTALFFSTMLAFPLVLILGLFFVEYIWIILGIHLLGGLYLVMILLAKYSVYPQKISLPQSILIALGIWFPPALLGIIPFFYSKSIKQLKRILI